MRAAVNMRARWERGFRPAMSDPQPETDSFLRAAVDTSLTLLA